MYARDIDARALHFDFGQGLVNDNLLFVDRQTSSVWSQLRGSAVAGPLAGTPLVSLPAMQSTWAFWRTRHPDTLVWVPQSGRRIAYHYRSRRPGAPSPDAKPTAHDTSALGLGLAIGDDAMFFPLDALERAGDPLRISVGGRPVIIYHDRTGLTAWAEDEAGTLLPAVLAYDFGWQRFFPQTRRWPPQTP